MEEDFYKPEVRHIYSLFDGAGVKKVDPMPVYKRLMDVVGDLSADIAIMNSPSAASWQAHTKIAEKSYKIFEIKPFSEGGLTEQEAINLLFHFWNWCDGVKKNTKPGQTFPEDSPDSCPPPSDDP